MDKLRRDIASSLIKLLIFGLVAGSTCYLFLNAGHEHADNARLHAASKAHRDQLDAQIQANHRVVVKLLESIRLKESEHRP